MISLSCGCGSLNLSLSRGGWRQYISRVYCFANCTTLTLITKVGKSSSSCGYGVTMIVPNIIYLIFPVHFNVLFPSLTRIEISCHWSRFTIIFSIQFFFSFFCFYFYFLFLHEEKDTENNSFTVRVLRKEKDRDSEII